VLRYLFSYLLDNFCRYPCYKRVGWYILGYYCSCSHYAMVTNRNAWQYHGVRTNPYVILDGYGIGAYTLLVYPFVGVIKIVVQCRYGNALR